MINVMTPLLEVRGLTVELPTAAGWVRPVNEVSLRIAAGESLGLVGESGSGKSMFSLGAVGFCFRLGTGQRRSIASDGSVYEKFDGAERAGVARRARPAKSPWSFRSP